MSGPIRIRGARQNNLADVDVEVPRNRLVAITGVSGSGKSSLAFDTLFREGQRRFLETLSAYARQFLGRMEKPDVESIEGLSPAIAVDQKAASTSPRSTVGTLTEIFDHLRVLFARAGVAHCPDCGLPLRAQTPESIVSQVLAGWNGQGVLVLAPLVRDRKGSHEALFADLARRGYVRARVDGAVRRIEEVGALERYKRHTIEVVVDRLRPSAEEVSRLREAVDGALELGRGELAVVAADEAEAQPRGFSVARTCAGCGAETPPLEPRLFSFNSPHGSCPECEGLGELRRPTEARVVGDASLSIRAGALAVTRKNGQGLTFPRVDFRFLAGVAKAAGFDLDTPWRELPKAARRVVLSGAGNERYEDTAEWNGARYQGKVTWQRRWRGVLPAVAEAWKKGQKQALRFVGSSPCAACAGVRLNRHALAVRFGGLGLGELLALPVQELGARLAQAELGRQEARIAEELLAEVRRRVDFLVRVGLGYLSLARGADTLSGGEAQRIRLAAQLSSGLQGVLYVLDEPSIGLHARDHARLLGALRALRDGGNTVVVVEHDAAPLRTADWVIDIGPGAGRHGGRVVAQGPPEVVALADSPTGRFLRGEVAMPQPRERRTGDGRALVVRGARAFNLKDIDARFPLGVLNVVTGVSGSGKSSLVNRILRPAVQRHLGLEGPDPADHDRVEGLAAIEELCVVDAAPIGRTPRSNPATYTGVLTPIRELFASVPEARMRGWDRSRFSFNVEGGRCEACGGAGAQLVELQFLAPVTVACGECGGERFQDETLSVRYREKSIADVLAMTVEEAREFFADHPAIARVLDHLSEVGLDYLTLGQPSTTLSGGEAQRIKLVAHLQRAARRHTLYLLDEPTTGLHPVDVARLVGALQRLVDQGHTVVVIEHNLDVVRAADRLIDLGPEGGSAGGELLAEGTPEELTEHAQSPTGEALRGAFAAEHAEGRMQGDSLFSEVRGEETHVRVVNARTHNLQHVDVAIPRDALTVVTGPSGSGKSSLALDTIHAEGKRRFVESLSTYARQFLGTRDRPPVDRVDGLGPSIAVEAGTSRGHPRSTVATTTELHDHLRVLFARAGTPRCPEHGLALETSDPGHIARRVLSALAGKSGWVLAPVFGPGLRQPDDLRAAYAAAAEGWRAAGFLRALVDGREVRLDAKPPRLAKRVRIDLVIDRVGFERGTRARLAEALEQAAQVGEGRVSVLERDGDGLRLEFSTRGACPTCGFRLEHTLEPRHFSFNTHVGACEDCDGLGARPSCDAALLVERPGLPLYEGALNAKLGRYLIKGQGYYEHLLRTVARSHRIDLTKPFERLTPKQRDLILHGTGARAQYAVTIQKSRGSAEIEERFQAEWPGLCGHVNAWHARTEDPEWAAILERSMVTRTCASCAGERLRPGARAVTLARARLPEVLTRSVLEARAWLSKLELPDDIAGAVAPVLAEIDSRLALLEKVGLGYLTLDRPTHTLSGGEARRVRLSASLGSRLVGVCYVLDEPTVGLHPADVERLTDALLELREGGNTVIVVEHDENLMERADFLVDMGPGAGRSGGRVVASGTPAELRAHPASLTGAALRGELSPPRPVAREREGALAARISGAKLFNLKNAALTARFGEVLGVCGPSGSGKSTLVLECLVPALRGEAPDGRWKRLEGPRGGAVRCVVIDASPIGRSPSSCPATYTGLLDSLRELFARTPESRLRGFTTSHFSFNSPRGRCPACDGRGAVKVEMHFLADLWLSCEECEGRRYQPEVLAVRYRGRSIADVLDLSVDDAFEFLGAVPAARTMLQTLRDVGLGYMALGQSSTTLSGGEAQRVKLASELALAADQGPSVLVLDEPSTGLHASDVCFLAAVLRRLADAGHALVVIEHHTGLLVGCDRLLELGPEGGAAGGRVLAEGTPEELAREPASVTGPFLARELARAEGAGPARRPRTRRRTKPREVLR
ncbi:MAG TPA: excinuclease ABC subunit UvrA [Planctomycetota bacterium]|nr:excinuclease ABC subunit UvrA [Planctomycetota bacterium]